MADLGSLTSGDFTPLVGGEVMLRADGLEMAAQVRKVLENPRSTPKGAPRMAFSIILSVGSPDAVGGDYVVAHPTLGDLPPAHLTRIVPGEMGSDEAWLQLIFN